MTGHSPAPFINEAKSISFTEFCQLSLMWLTSLDRQATVTAVTRPKCHREKKKEDTSCNRDDSRSFSDGLLAVHGQPMAFNFQTKLISPKIHDSSKRMVGIWK